jgi:predicted RNA-binding protein YlxR (DUF448 family)
MHKLAGKVVRIVPRHDCFIAMDIHGQEVERGRYFCTDCLHCVNEHNHGCREERESEPTFYFSDPSLAFSVS